MVMYIYDRNTYVRGYMYSKVICVVSSSSLVASLWDPLFKQGPRHSLRGSMYVRGSPINRPGTGLMYNGSNALMVLS